MRRLLRLQDVARPMIPVSTPKPATLNTKYTIHAGSKPEKEVPEKSVDAKKPMPLRQHSCDEGREALRGGASE